MPLKVTSVLLLICIAITIKARTIHVEDAKNYDGIAETATNCEGITIYPPFQNNDIVTCTAIYGSVFKVISSGDPSTYHRYRWVIRETGEVFGPSDQETVSEYGHRVSNLPNTIFSSPNGTLHYDLEVSTLFQGCESDPMYFTIEVARPNDLNINLILPFSNPLTICEGSSITCVAETNIAGGIFSWYDPFGNLLGEGSSLDIIPTYNLLSYEVVYEVVNCGQTQIEDINFSFQIIPNPPIPTIEDIVIERYCDYTLVKKVQDNPDLFWVTEDNEIIDNSLEKRVEVDGTYLYLSSIFGSCRSSKLPILVNVVGVPSLTIEHEAAVCENSVTSITAVTDYTNPQYMWYKLSLDDEILLQQGESNVLEYKISESTQFKSKVLTPEGCMVESVFTIETNDINFIPERPFLINNEDGSFSISPNITNELYNYYWQYEKNGVDDESDNNFPNILNENVEVGVYYIRARNKSDECWQGSMPIEVPQWALKTVDLPATSDNVNYIIKYNFLFEAEGSDPNTLNYEEVSTHYSYFDGLGRLIQERRKKWSQGLADFIETYSYDWLGRNIYSYLPFITNQEGHGIVQDPFLKLSVYYDQSDGNMAMDSNPFARNIYEPSPLNRVVEQGLPGEAWQPGTGKTIRYQYKINGADEVGLWELSSGIPETTTSYSAGQLYKNVTTDAEDHQVIEFVDKLGQTILKRVQANEAAMQWADTYYIYDDFGNLRFVLPPEASDRIAAEYTGQSPANKQAFLDRWAFQYKYDGRNRMIEKKVPGSGRVYMVYDKRDRLVLTQDGNQRQHDADPALDNEWAFTKYDALNRPVATGTYVDINNRDRASMQSYADGRIGDEDSWYETTGGSLHGYTDHSFPAGVPLGHYLTFTYYDNYAFMSVAGFNDLTYDNTQLESATCAQGTYDFPGSEFDRVKGQVTGSKVKVLGTADDWINTVTYYDRKYRVIQTVTGNDFQGSTTRMSNIYNFPGWLLTTYTEQTRGTETLGTKKRYVYDHAGRLMRGYHQLIDNGIEQPEVFLAGNKYNELGELIEKNLHVENDIPQQSIDYRYNIRGWLERINNAGLLGGAEDTSQPEDYFGMELLYNHPLNGVPNQ